MVPPENSAITTVSDANGQPMLVLPAQKAGAARWGVAAFLGFWLCGWAVGEVTVIGSLLFGKTSHVSFFLLAWLGGWTVGGAFAITAFCNMLRKPVPETITFLGSGLAYDTGRQPWSQFGNSRQYNGYYRGRLPWRKRKVYTFAPAEVSTIALRETDFGNRLTIDHGNDRIDIGRGLTEVEREWLCKEIKQRCGVK